MTTTIRWIDNSSVEQGHRIYKSNTYFTKDNLPPMLVELWPDVEEYVDEDGEDGENWYIVSAFTNDYEVFSEPFIGGLTTAVIHDIFGDGGSVATYRFDGDATDLGGNFNLTESSGASYTDGLIGKTWDIKQGEFLKGDSSYFNLGTTDWTFSFWTKLNSYSSQSGTIEARFFSKAYRGNASTRYTLSISSDGGVRWVADGAGDYTTSPNTVPLNEWVHVCFKFIRSTSNVSELYINGVLVDNNLPSLSSSTNRTSSYEFGIGSYNNSSGNIDGVVGVLDGLIDQFRIFNRILTEQEVQALYQEGAMFL